MAIRWITQSCLLHALLVAIGRAEEVFNTTPAAIKTNFSCRNRPMGFYADVEANCKVYYTCDDHGNRFSYRCPEETAFRQDALICDHAHLVDCQTTTYPTTQSPSDNTDKDNANAIPPIKSPFASIDSFEDHRVSFSRSFQVIQRPDKSVSNKIQPGFVFRASVFLKDQDPTRGQDTQVTSGAVRMCDSDLKNRAATSTVRTFVEPFNPWTRRNDESKSSSNVPRFSPPSPSARTFARNKNAAYLRRSFEPTSSPSSSKGLQVNQQLLMIEKSPSLSRNSYYAPYSETLRSIQANAARTASAKSTTEIPVHALTFSLQPLIPNELEYDPYYPRQPTSTEAYYTPSNRNKIDARDRSFGFSQTPPTFARSFEIPPVLPDLNALEDLIDRRKFFYIPRTNAKPI